MVNDFFEHELDNVEMDDQDAACHTADKTINLLKQTFGGRIFSHRGPVA